MSDTTKLVLVGAVGVVVGVVGTIGYAKYAYNKAIKAEVKGAKNGNK